MIKHVLLTGAMLVAAPALAQTASAGSGAAPGRAPAAQAGTTTVSPQTSTRATPDTATPASAPAEQTDVTTTGAQTVQQQSSPSAQSSAPQTATAQPATTAQPASTGNQVAQIVDTEFPSYDKDGDGKLNREEFGAWMVALKTASDPSTKADAAATKSWIGAAFVQADKDKSASLSKVELTGFLSQGKS